MTKTYKYLCFGLLGLASSTLVSCNDWLSEQAPGTTTLDDFFTSGETAVQIVTGAYVPLMWEYSSRDTYCPEWFISDVASDDALKGGQSLSDMSEAYDIENFKTVASNTLVRGFYRAQFYGVSRCNMALKYVPDVAEDETMDASMKKRLIAEAKFLRAYYYFKLLRVFGGVPKVDAPIESSDDWKQPRASADEIYAFILQDLEEAKADLWNRSEYPAADLGRATRGAALAMLMKVNLYKAGMKAKEDPAASAAAYQEAYKWGKEFMETQAGEYDLNPNYFDNFVAEGDNTVESVFEVQYINESTSDFGGDSGGFGGSRGTFTPILTRPRVSALVDGNEGWGFNRPTQDLYDEFEEGDPRREYTIMNPDPALIAGSTDHTYLGDNYVSRKYLYEDKSGAFLPIENKMRCSLNRKEIRYSDVLLMWAEACIETNQSLDEAKTAINRVRARVGLGEVEATRENLRHERRVELAMEGHRWYDLCRWGIVAETMQAYKAKWSSGDHYEGTEMADFVVGKHELFPIPAEEARLGGLAQNNGY